MATHTQVQRKDLVSADVNTRLTLFSMLLTQSWYGLQQHEIVELGLQDSTTALNYKMPIPIGSPFFTQWINGIKYRDVSHLMLAVTVGDWADGVRAEVKKLQSDEWSGYAWGQQPTEMAAASAEIAVRLHALALEAGETTASVENALEGDASTTIKIFAQNKPVDPQGESSVAYDNLFTGSGTGAMATADAAPLTLTNIDRVWHHIRTVKAQNGRDYRDLVWRYVEVPPTMELKARRYFENQGDANAKVIEASGSSTAEVEKPNTARQYGIKVIVNPYLTVADTWYPICVTRTMAKCPWITLTQIPANTVPLVGSFPSPPAGASPLDPGFEWIIDGLDSHLYKHGIPGEFPPGYVAIAAKRSVGVAITEPWRIFKCKAT